MPSLCCESIPKFKLGDRIKNIDYRYQPSPDNNIGKKGTVIEIETKYNQKQKIRIRYDDGCSGVCDEGGKYYQLINTKSIMENIVTFAKNLVLSADEKLLRKQGLKNDCGDYTLDARELVLNKLVAENEKYLIEIATKKEAEETKKD